MTCWCFHVLFADREATPEAGAEDGRAEAAAAAAPIEAMTVTGGFARLW